MINKLNLNDNPKDIENGSLVYAANVQLDKTGTIIENEDALLPHSTIISFINSIIGPHKIIYCMTTSHELVILTISDNNSNKVYIFRYNEHTNSIKFFTNKLIYHNGKYIGKATYNFKNQLIINLSEYDADIDVPFKSFNIGAFEDGYDTLADYNNAEIEYNNNHFYDDKYCDKFYEDDYLVTTPKIILPNNIDIEYVEGRIYKGLYDIFIRYKINNYDYTNWINIGRRVIVDSLNRYNIIKYPYNMRYNETTPAALSGLLGEHGFALGCSDYFSDNTDISNYSFKIEFADNNNIYFQYQLAFVVNRKDSTKCFKTSDINKTDIISYTINQAELEEYSINDIITFNKTYYDVRACEIYNDRLYIAKYKEFKTYIDDINYNSDNVIISFTQEYRNVMHLDANLTLFNSDINNDWQATSRYISMQREDTSIVFCIPLTELFHLNDPTITIPGEENITYRYWKWVKVNLTMYLTRNDGKADGSYSYAFIVKGYDDGTRSESGQFATLILSENPDEYVDTYKQTDSGDFVVWNQIKFREVCSYQGKTINGIVYDVNGKKHSYPGGANIYISSTFINTYSISGTSYKLIATGETEVIDTSTSDVTYTLNERDCLTFNNDNGNYVYRIHFREQYINSGIFTINTNDGKTLSFGLDKNSWSYYYNETYFIDTNQNFTGRLNTNNLIPGAYYSFYIHYIDEYGNHTNGININNNKFYVKVFTDNTDLSKMEIIDGSIYNIYYIDYFTDIRDYSYKVYALCKPDEYIMSRTDGKITAKYFILYNDNPRDINYRKFDIFNYEALSNVFYGMFNEHIDSVLISKFGNETNKLWQELDDYVSYYGIGSFINKYIKEGITYYKVPYNPLYDYGFKVEVNAIPKEYKGYFISYERLDTVVYKGILSINDVSTESVDYWNTPDNNNSITNAEQISISNKKNFSKFKFFTDEININDEIKNNITNIVYFNSASSYAYYTGRFHANNSHYLTNLNKYFMYNTNDTDLVYSSSISNVQFVDAYTNKTNLFNVGSYITFNADIDIDGPNIAYICTNKINFNSNKNLIRCSDYYYTTGEIELYRDGVYDIQGVLVYNSNGVVLNDSEKYVTTTTNTRYINEIYSGNINDSVENDDSINNFSPFAIYAQWWCVDDYLHESKCFNNEPVIIVKTTYNNDKRSSYSYGNYVYVENSKDLFINKSIRYIDNNIITYKNNIANNNNIYQFNKTIVRSSIYQNESAVNRFRIINGLDYKILNTNKGDIINIVSNSKIFIVHTQYSLFILSSENTLSTTNNNIQLANTDIFDLDYKELIVSAKGSAGIQNIRHAIIGEFGYIWYNNLDKHIYKLFNGRITKIDDDISDYINNKDFSNLFIGDDIKRQRIIFFIDDEAISYNYKVNNFISLHDYSNIINCWSTANNIYINFMYRYINIWDDPPVEEEYYNICYYDTNSKNILQRHSTATGTMINANSVSVVSVIFNANYNNMKRLRNIVYNLRANDINNFNIGIIPLDANTHFYAGDKLRVYSNVHDTDTLDISINDNNTKNSIMNVKNEINDIYYDKPYWHLGSWNFNYLFDKKYGNDSNAYLSGNYFIARFEFSSNDKVIKFEDVLFNLLEQ